MPLPADPAAATRQRVRFDILLISAACVAFVAAVFIPGLRLAKTLSSDAAALKFVSEQRRYSLALASTLQSVQDRLDSGGYIQTPLDQLRADEQALSGAVAQMSGARPIGWFDAPTEISALADPQVAASIAALGSEWRDYRVHLRPVLEFKGIPYHDSESAGTHLNPAGRRLAEAVGAALHAGHQALPRIDGQFDRIGDELERGSALAASRLSLVMLAGLLLAATMVALGIALQIARQNQEQAVREARRQTESIFRTVKEGLFLLDRDLTIGAAYSAAMQDIFKREDIAGLSFEELLKDLVPEKTLATALKFAKVLWTERTKENLVKTINPLGEVEARFNTESGAEATRYLDFDFHRVRTGNEITHLLVSVSDVSARVALANELKSAQDRTQSQIDTLLGLLKVDPAQLASFLADSDAGLRMVNTILREPAREAAAFRKKVDSIFRQVHSIKGEAAAIGLSTIEDRAHRFEEDLRVLRDKADLSGNDFLPLIVKLDDLLTHLQSIRELVAQLSRLQIHPGKAAARPAGGDATAGADLGTMLDQLAQRIAQDSGKSARVALAGMELLPNTYRRLVKDVAVQAVRNAVMHGIEAPQERALTGKDDCGLIRIDIAAAGADGYRVSIEDDGRGIAMDKVVASAVQRGLVNAQDVPTLGPKQVLRLLFRPGFSTVEQASKDAGRGVGMNLIWTLVQEAGGRIGVSSTQGKFTRLTINLPALRDTGKSHEAA